MKRRHFIRAATGSVLFPAALLSFPAARAALSRDWDYLFFDERFERARRLAASWPASCKATGVQGDITPLWSSGLDRLTRDHPINLRGVTTGSFQFCLRILLGEHSHLEVQVSRLDRDLFCWTMRATPKFTTPEQTHG